MIRSSGVMPGLVKYLCLKKSGARDALCSCADCPEFPAAVVLSGCAQHVCLAAVFSKGSLVVRFVVYHGFHANGDEGVFVVIVLFVDMSVCREVWM